MNEEPAEYRCFQCGVSHKIAAPSPRADNYRCEVCGMRYWSAIITGNKVRVGIDPSHYAP